jgi:hypothetical protein
MNDPSNDLASLVPMFAGYSKRARETDLPEGAMREVSNITIDEQGKPRRRRGYTRIIEMYEAHSLWSNGHVMVAAVNGDICLLDPKSRQAEVIYPAGGSSPLSYAEVNEWLYFTSFNTRGRLNLTDPTILDSSWGCDTPEGTPQISLVGGGLVEGQYEVTITYVSWAGEESGAPAPHAVTIVEPGKGILLSNIPQGQGDTINIYCTTPNGTALLKQASIPMGTTEYAITNIKRGRECTTLFLEPLPPGAIVRYYRGRMFVAEWNTVWFSEPLHYNLHHPDNGYLPPFSAPVTMIEVVEDGMYIGAGKTYFVRGSGPDDFQISLVDDGKPIRGSSMVVNAPHVVPDYIGYVAFWYTENGPVIGVNGGMTKQIGMDRMDGIKAEIAATGFMRDNGVARMITAIPEAADRSSFGCTDSATIEVIRSASL